MRFDSRVFKLAKDPDQPGEYEDAYRLDAERGIAAVADGVASAIFSGQWARQLTEAIVADTVDPTDREAFAGWLKRLRAAWSGQIDTGGLAWFQKAKLPLGAFSTLLWVSVAPPEVEREGAFGAYRLQSFAIGDSCLFHVRGGELVRTFPIQTADQLQADPLVVGSIDLKRDDLIKFVSLDELCYTDDLLVLCTDAVAEWALRCHEEGNPPAWENYWQMTEQAWKDEVLDLRQRRRMRWDDATLMLLRVGAAASKESEVGQPEEPPLSAEVVEPRPQPASAEAPADVAGQDWLEKFKSGCVQVSEGIDQVSDEMLRNMKKLKEAAVKKYRDRFGPRDK